MSEIVYIRLDKEKLKFIKEMSKEEKTSRSETINKLLDYASNKLKVEKAVNNYKEGKNTIRECAEIASMKYFEFFEVLIKNNLIGTSTINIDIHLSKMNLD